MKAIILISLVVLLMTGLTSFMACGPSAEEVSADNLKMAAQYDAKAKVEEQLYKEFYEDSRSEYGIFEYTCRQGEPDYASLAHAEELSDIAFWHYQKADEYRQLAKQYRLKASR